MLDGVDKSTVVRIPSLEERVTFRWSRFILESVLAIGGALVVTGLIGFFQLYPWTYLEQVTSLIERALLRSAAV